MKKSVRRRGVISILPFVFASLLILLSAGQSLGQGQPGTLDTSFNGTGQVLTDFSSLSGSVNSAAQAVAIQADGKIVAAGYSYPDLALSRYNTDGSLDTTFNGTGRTVTAYAPGCCASAQAVAIQGDGKIVTAGSPNFALGRYNTDGSLDTTFNGTGQVSAILTAMAIQADGKIVTAGYGGGYFVLARFNTDGTLDTSFNATGQVWTAFSGAAFASAQAVAVQGDGRILAAGGVNISGTYYSSLVRYNADGTLDTTFNGTGQVLTNFSDGTVSYSVTIQADSKIVTAGGTTVSGTGEFWLARYNTDGTLDTGFNGTGQVATPFSSGATDTSARAVAILADGKIVAAGYSSSGYYQDYQVALAQYNTNGTLDTNFNGTGQVLTSFPGYADNLALSEAIQADGKIVTAGYVFGNGLGQVFFALDRYNGGCTPPIVASTSGPSGPIALGGSASVAATFTDASTTETHTCSIAWGDSTSNAGTVSESNGSGTCTGSHQYAAAGVYEVTFTITGSCSASGTGVFQFDVIYDANGGFVTGGGWINSPAGAYAANTSLTGKATFGFVSKYVHGSTVPTGNTEFDFHTASFDFKSASYNWLVISGAKARYHGTGQVNGTGSFGFELTAWDGDVSGGGGVDKFRLKVWDQNQGNAVVYDNQMNASDGSDPTTALGGGDIVIHK